MTATDEPKWTEINLVHEGKWYRGEYCVEDGMVTLRSSIGSNSTQIGGVPVESLARALLRERIEGGNADEYNRSVTADC